MTTLSTTDTLTDRKTALTPVSLLLRAEGALVGAAAIAAYAYLGQSWWLFAALILAPDLFMLGYLRGPRTGAAVYNFAHTYLVPAALGLLGFGFNLPLVLGVAAIWAAHIGLDRAMGYGLKSGAGFKGTHLS